MDKFYAVKSKGVTRFIGVNETTKLAKAKKNFDATVDIGIDGGAKTYNAEYLAGLTKGRSQTQTVESIFGIK